MNPNIEQKNTSESSDTFLTPPAPRLLRQVKFTFQCSGTLCITGDVYNHTWLKLRKVSKLDIVRVTFTYKTCCYLV